MTGIHCDIYPLVNGDPSSLYMDLLHNFCGEDRLLANYVYASYLQQGVADQMDQIFGNERNKQGEHKAKDVFKMFDVGKIMAEQSDELTALKKAGTIDSDGKIITYDNPETALQKADTFNDSDLGKAWSATVYQRGDKFQIATEKRNSRTVEDKSIVKEQIKAWSTVDQAFTSSNLTLKEALAEHPILFNPINIKGMLEWVKSIKDARRFNINILNTASEKDFKVLLALNSNDTIVERLIRHFGDRDTAANSLYDYHHNNRPFSHAENLLMQGVSSVLLKMGNLDIDGLINQVNNESTAFRASSEDFLISDTIKSWGSNVNVNVVNDIHETGARIRNLSEAAIRAVKVLERKLLDAKNDKDVDKITDLQQKINRIMKLIEGKMYYGGTLELLQNVSDDVSNILTQLQTTTYGSNLDKIRELTKNYRAVTEIIEEYSDVIGAISEADSLIINENIGSNEIARLQSVATSLKKSLAQVEDLVNSSKVKLVTDIIIEYLGDRTINGMSIGSLVNMHLKDTWLLDKLFASTDSSNDLVSVVSTIIRRAQQSRNDIMLGFSDRIMQEEKKLRKAGIKNTDWMFEHIFYQTKDGEERDYYMIKSDRNYSEYHSEQAKHRAYAENYLKLTGYQLEAEMLDWEKANTEEVEVDKKNHRTERLPRADLYGATLQFNSKAEEDYYNNMMQIKAELETLLPDYARGIHNPVQLRMGYHSAISEAFRNPEYKNLSLRDSKLLRLFKLTGSHMADPFVWRENDELVDRRGNYHGAMKEVKDVDAKGHVKKRIPVFYKGRLKDQSMLEKNFAFALSKLAGTAVNFNAMQEIEDTVLFMQDFIRKKAVAQESSSGNPLIKTIRSGRNQIVKMVTRSSEDSAIAGQLSDIIDSNMYGMVRYKRNWYNKLITSLLGYSSETSLKLNSIGAGANAFMGKVQTVIEAVGGEFYNLNDWRKAEAHMFNVKSMGERMADVVNGTKLSLDTLLNHRFDVQQKLFENLSNRRYYRRVLSRALQTGHSIPLYEAGEYLIHQTNMKAILYHERALLNNKEVPLIKVFDKTAPVDGVCELIIKQGATRLDGSPITEEYLDSLRDIIKLLNQEQHGAMSTEDRGTARMYMLGKALLHFRQWMIKHFSRRFRGKKEDPLTRKLREGYYVTTSKMLIASTCGLIGANTLSKILSFNNEWAEKAKLGITDFVDEYSIKDTYKNRNKDSNAKMRLANLKKAIFEQLVLCLGFNMLLGTLKGDDDDKKKKGKRRKVKREWGEAQLLRLVDRMYVEIKGSTPMGLISEFKTLVNNPIPSVSTADKLLYPITNISDIGEKYESGRFKGRNKYIHNVTYLTAPYVKHLDQFINPEEHDQSLLSK